MWVKNITFHIKLLKIFQILLKLKVFFNIQNIRSDLLSGKRKSINECDRS
jgi:hypothetical protein